jgi:hypothetical protein
MVSVYCALDLRSINMKLHVLVRRNEAVLSVRYAEEVGCRPVVAAHSVEFIAAPSLGK